MKLPSPASAGEDFMASIAAAWRHYISGWLALGLGLTVPASAAGLDEALTQGKFALHTRLRWEQAEQTGLHPSDALTLRGRLGFTSAPVSGVQGMIELEHIAALNDENDYSAGGTNPGGAGRTVIADPPGTQLNQAWLAYTRSGFTSKAGPARHCRSGAR